MKIKLKSGVFNVRECRVLTEKRFVYNGRKHRLCEMLEDSSDEANGLAIYFTEQNMNNAMFGDGMESICILNLKSSYVEKVLNSLLTSGYADLSELNFQKFNFDPCNNTFDGGESLPYKVSTSMGITSFFGGMGMGMGANSTFSAPVFDDMSPFEKDMSECEDVDFD